LASFSAPLSFLKKIAKKAVKRIVTETPTKKELYQMKKREMRIRI
jgi:hypothetical protein